MMVDVSQLNTHPSSSSMVGFFTVKKPVTHYLIFDTRVGTWILGI